MALLKLPATFLYGVPPQSALTCAIEGDPAPDAGPPQAAPVMPPATSTPALTPEIQALIDAARSEERTRTQNAVWKQAREKYEKTPPAPAARPEPAPPPLDDTRSLLQLRDDFDDAASEFTLDPAQRRFLRGLVLDKRPTDVGAFMRETVGALGLSRSVPSPTPAPAQPVAPTAASPAPPPASAPARVIPADQRIVDMTPAERRSLAERIGNTAFRDRLRSENRADTRRVALGKP